jgi:hypothetical protein
MEGTKYPDDAGCQPSHGPRRRPPRVSGALRLAGLLLATALAAAPSQAAAEESGGSRHGSYYGAFAGFELKAGTAFLGIDPTRNRAPHARFRPLVAGSARFANLLSLIDLDVGVGWSFGAEEAVSGRYDVHHARFFAEARLHPFFMSHLQGQWFRAGLHLTLGVGADLLATRPLGETSGSTRHDVAFALAIGAGFDVPLSDLVSADPSVWLTVGWRMRFVGFDGAPRGFGDRDGHDVFVSLSVRWHDIGFARFPRPPELDDRDRP